jgi:hypothetical protein
VLIVVANKYRYRYRELGSQIAWSITKREGQEICFGQELKAANIALPNPHFCNLKLNIAKVLHASGAAEVLDQYDRDMDELKAMGEVYFGGPYFSDDFLIEVLEGRLVNAKA